MIETIHADEAATVLKGGGVIAYPTEAVWGFGCDPFNLDAVQRLLTIKQRAFEKGVLLVAAEIESVEPWLSDLPETVKVKMLASWPGPTTWVVPNKGILPDVVTGGRETVALRVSAHEGVQRLCRAFGGLVVSTSANKSGEPPCMAESEVAKQFEQTLDYIVPGRLGGAAKPSSIFNALTGEQLR